MSSYLNSRLKIPATSRAVDLQVTFPSRPRCSSSLFTVLQRPRASEAQRQSERGIHTNLQRIILIPGSGERLIGMLKERAGPLKRNMTAPSPDERDASAIGDADEKRKDFLTRAHRDKGCKACTVLQLCSEL